MKPLRAFLYFHAALSVLFVAMAWRDGIAEDADLRFVVNTTGKDGLFAIASVVAARNLPRLAWISLLLVGAYGCLILGQALELIFADPARVESWPADADATAFLLAWMGADVVIAGLILWLYRRAVGSAASSPG